MKDSVIIIGAGVAGLAAGCYAQMNGYSSQIFELHDLPGGLCTAWERKGYQIDGCIHYLFGTAPGQPFHQVWEELGVLEGVNIINHEELLRVIDTDGRTFHLYADPDRLEAHMKELSPADAGLIEPLAEGIRHFMSFDMAIMSKKPRSLMNAADWLEFNRAVLGYAVPMARWGQTSARELADRFHDPLLRRAFPHVFGWADIPVMVGMSVLAYMATGNAGFPAGGSLPFARALERRYQALGGQIHYQAQVEKILVEDGRAVGVRLYNDEEHRARTIISAADGRGTLFDLLGEEYATPRQRDRYDGHLPVHSQILVALGVNRDLAGEPHWATYLLPEPLLIAGEERLALGVKTYCFDPSLAPPGKSVIQMTLESNYGYWQRIYGRRLYDMEQLQVADIAIDFLETLYPGIGGDVEVADVATPLSYERYTGNWLGSTCGWLLTDKTMMMMVRGVSKTVPDLENFYMAGQWVEPGGSVPIVAMSGRNVIQLLCAADGREFVSRATP
jgi:phytoene dehydrogenase-like protein